jgi:hypothetical protein
MPFVKGQSGNPGGRTRNKPWLEALRLALHEETPDGRKRLRAIADKMVELALAGDLEAIREIGNRLDGRPRQQVEVDASVTAGESIEAILERRRLRTGLGD